MTQYEDSHYYHSHGLDTQSRKLKLSSSRNKNILSQQKYYDTNLTDHNYQNNQSIQQFKTQNQKLKKALKQSNAKRSSLVKQCSEYQKQIELLDHQIQTLRNKVDQEKIDNQGERYRVEQLKFLNKQLSDQINELRDENQNLLEKVRYCSDVVSKKYADLQEKMMKRMQQSMKRVKKAVHYLQTLSIKDIEKTKEILIENLKKATQLLKGKYLQEHNTEHQIEQLMNPLKNLQQQLSQKSKELNLIKNQNRKLQEQLKKHKKIENELLPQYKQSIQGLKKNLVQVRAQLSENELEKIQIKKKYEQKIKSIQQQYQELLIEYRKNKLEKKIFENKLEELEEEKEEEKERLVGENLMLKKLYEIRNKTDFHQEIHSESQTQQHDRKVKTKQTDLKPHTRYNNFKRNPINSNQNNDDEQLLSGYNSAEYFNNHKTTKHTYGDEAIDERHGMGKKHSSKDIFIMRSQSRNLRQDNQKGKRTNNSVKNFSREKAQAFGVRDTEYENTRKGKYTKKQSSEEEQQQSLSGSGQQQERSDNQQEKQYGPGQSSMMSQQSLKNEICRIDQEIMQIQKNLTRELDAYK